MFQFRLQKVLHWRQRCSERQARVVQQASARLREVQGRRNALLAQITALTRWHARDRLRRPDMQLWSLQAGYLAVLYERLTALQAAEMEAGRLLASERLKLLEAHRAQEVLVRLRERQREAWQEQERRRERKQMDEVASRGTNRCAEPALPV